MSISPEEVSRTAILARLEVKGEEAIEVADRITAILDLVEQMQAVDTDGVAPMANPHDATQILRKDLVQSPDTQHQQRDNLLAIAPEAEQNLFLVPKVLD